jgi:hypothetical protein
MQGCQPGSAERDDPVQFERSLLHEVHQKIEKKRRSCTDVMMKAAMITAAVKTTDFTIFGKLVVSALKIFSRA